MNSGCGEELHQPRKRCLTCLHKTLQYHQSQPGTKHNKRTRVTSSTTSSPRRRTVRFASPLEIVHRVPSIWDLVEEHEMETLWIQADSFLRTIGEAVSQTEQEDPQLMAQEQYLQSLTEIYRHCCKGGDDDDDDDAEDCLFDSSDDDDDNDDSHHTSLQLVSPLLATYRGLEFVVVPELYKLRSRQRAASIQNLCALSRQVTGTSSCTSTTCTTHSSVPCLIAQVASRSSRTARRFARAMGMADALAVQEKPEKPESNATTSTSTTISQDCCHPRIQAVSPTTVSNIDGNSDSRTITATTTVTH